MAKSLVGLDIGSYSVKIVEVLRRGRKISLLSCGIKTIPAETRFESYVNILRKLCAEIGITNNYANCSVSGKDVVTRYAVFPALAKRALVRSLEFEFDKYIPFALNDCFVDLDILGKRPDGKIDVLIASVRKYRVEERIKVMTEAGIVHKTITIDSLALYKGFIASPFFSKDNSFVLINLGHITTSLLIIRKGVLIFSRDITLGGDNFNRSIADRMDIPILRAEELKYRHENLSLIENLAVDLDYLINEIQMSIEYSKWNYNTENIQCVYLSGGSSKLKGLLQFLENRLKIKTNLWNPFVGLKKTKDFPILEENYQDLALAFSIAVA